MEKLKEILKTMERSSSEYLYDYEIFIAVKKWLQQKQEETLMENQKAIVVIDELLEGLQ